MISLLPSVWVECTDFDTCEVTERRMLDIGIICEMNSSLLNIVGDACRRAVDGEEFITISATGKSVLDEVIYILHVNVYISTLGVSKLIDNIRSAIVLSFHNHESST